MNQNKQKSVSFVAVLIAAVGMWSALGMTRAEACATGQSCASHVFGITRGETARAYGFNTGEVHGVIAIIRYFDTAGNLLAESELRVALGEVAFFDLNADQLNFGNAQRLAIRVDIILELPTADKSHKPDAFSSLELFDNATGQTLFLAEDHKCK